MFEFTDDTALWSISKKKWIEGPKLPYMIGLEDGCATALNRTSVIILGMTYLGTITKKQNFNFKNDQLLLMMSFFRQAYIFRILWIQ